MDAVSPRGPLASVGGEVAAGTLLSVTSDDAPEDGVVVDVYLSVRPRIGEPRILRHRGGCANPLENGDQSTKTLTTVQPVARYKQSSAIAYRNCCISRRTALRSLNACTSKGMGRDMTVPSRVGTVLPRLRRRPHIPPRVPETLCRHASKGRGEDSGEGTFSF